MVVGPGFFQAVGEFFYGLDALGVPDQETRRCCTQPTYEKEYVFHRLLPFVRLLGRARFVGRT